MYIFETGCKPWKKNNETWAHDKRDRRTEKQK
jgi:hypothetical protein